ncbi:MAG: PIN domain-containing protein [Nitrospinae bacterium]|nr:PIN domain-containing protein [Nitrospinota bacterium]
MHHVLLDTGPLVAFLNNRDHNHEWTLEQWAAVQPPFLTCETVLAEACFLLGNIPGGSQAVMELFKRKVITIPFVLNREIASVAKLMTRYQNIPMSLTDACLVRMAEQHAKSTLLTLDQDFQIYRKNGRQMIPLQIPKQV